jgi:hypothetical protein
MIYTWYILKELKLVIYNFLVDCIFETTVRCHFFQIIIHLWKFKKIMNMGNKKVVFFLLLCI